MMHGNAISNNNRSPNELYCTLALRPSSTSLDIHISTMSDSTVVIKTRKFIKNPLLARRQVRSRTVNRPVQAR